MGAGELLDLAVVEESALRAHAVGHHVEPLAAEIINRAVAEMAAGIEIHAEDRLAGVGDGMQNGMVRLAAGMRLHVGEATAEELAGAVDGQLLDDVDIGGAAVV